MGAAPVLPSCGACGHHVAACPRKQLKVGWVSPSKSPNKTKRVHGYELVKTTVVDARAFGMGFRCERMYSDMIQSWSLFVLLCYFSM